MSNLLNETIEYLEGHGKTISDIKWVGCRDFWIDISQFLELANVEYDDGYGAPEVATDLIVVGDGWWIERHEYDGSEWWEFKTLPQMPMEKRTIRTLVGGCWDSLRGLNYEP